MAYYRNAPGQKGRINYAEKGSWDEEGTHYRSGKNAKAAFAEKSDIKAAGKKSTMKKPLPGEGMRRKDRSDFENSDHKTDIKLKGNFQTSRYESRREAMSEKGYPTRKPLRKKEAPEASDYHDYEYRDASAGKPEEKMDDHILCGRNPIREALRSGRDIEKLLVQKGELSGSARDIIREARDKKIMVQEVDRRRLDEIALHHQGLVAFAAAYQYAEVEDILNEAERRGEAPFVIILDGVTDPHNLGAVIRTAECAGAHGVILPIHRSVGLSPAAVKASAGAIEHMKVARVINLNRAIDELKKRGIWTYAVTMNGRDFEKVDFSGPTALVIGAEGEGISRLTEERCDLSVSLPLRGTLDSLNASVAAGVMMYRVLSCRRK